MIPQFSQVGQLLSQPVIPPAGVSTPEPQNVGRWQAFQERLKNDPNLKMALLVTGLNLLKSQQPGQTGFDTFSNAALQGVGTLDTLRQRDLQQQQLEADKAFQQGQTERRTSAVEKNASTSATRALQSADQFNKNYELAKSQLDESVRHNKALETKTGASESTGTERLINQGVNALVTAMPDVYPDTPEGRAKARLRVQGIDQVSSDPNSGARIIASLFGDIQRNNEFSDKPLSNEDMAHRAVSMYQTFFQAAGGKQPEAAPDQLDGQTLNKPGQGVGTVRKVGEDRYVVEFEGGSTATITGETIKKLLAQYPNTETGGGS